MNKSLSTSASRTLLLLAVLISSVVSQAFAHGVTGGDQAYLMQVEGVNPFPFMYLGAKHMVTGYDHLLYLACVIFFLQNLKDVIKFVSLFALGHSITLLFGVLSGIHINAYFIDAIIGLSICYKALENLGAIRFLDPRLAVFGFGLAHGFGLSSKLQDLALSGNGLISNMIYFNTEPYDLKADVINQSIGGLLQLHDTVFKSATFVIDVEDFGEIEHKFIMDKNAALLYSWKVLDAKGDGVFYEFHGHPSSTDAPNYPDGFEQAYSKGEGIGQTGSFIAPFPGYHGWFFMNLEEGPIKIEVTVSGFYDEHKEMHRAVDGKVINTVAL